ncbi:hypothetical protein GN958_ATG18820 [Phytophthora infestans]|uniref:Uncharacterized protein n=1 Tax=Phytophthora infestans TaxID=4787 RepID=A0A8S9TYS0_PHYIN|nr:hypothetical protein GN958_ATG18820 [Phytophthora infestans]
MTTRVQRIRRRLEPLRRPWKKTRGGLYPNPDPKPGGGPSRRRLHKSLAQPDPEATLRDPRSKSTVTVDRVVMVGGGRLVVADSLDLAEGGPPGGGSFGSGGGGSPHGGGSPGSPHGGGSPGSPHGGGSPGSSHGGGSPGSVLIPAPPNSSLPGMLPVAPFGPDAAFISGRRAPVAFAARDIEPWSAKKLNRVAVISMKITVLFPELPFRAEWIFPRTADAIPRAGYVDSLITRPLVEELTSAAPWDTLVTTPVDPVSFRGGVRGRLGVFVWFDLVVQLQQAAW